MDSWSDKQIKMMRAGGNQKLTEWFESHDVTSDQRIAKKYHSPAAELFRERCDDAAAASICLSASGGAVFVELVLLFTARFMFRRHRRWCFYPCYSPISSLLVPMHTFGNVFFVNIKAQTPPLRTPPPPRTTK